MNRLVPAALLLCSVQAVAAPPAPPASRDEVVAEPAAPGDPDEAGIIWSHPDNPRMVAARDRARAELPDFFARMAAPAADEQNFHVKFDLGDGEYIWADRLSRENGRLTGRLTNTPLNTNFVLYQRVPIPEAAIYDWGYFRGPVMQGNYSTRVQLDFMAPAEAQQIRTAFGW